MPTLSDEACVTPCGLLGEDEEAVVGGLYGSPNPRILLIGDKPQADGKPLAPGSLRLLSTIFNGFDLDFTKDIAYCNVVSCPTPNAKNATNKEVSNCKDHFKALVNSVYDSVELIVLMGNLPLRVMLSLSGISKWRGKSKIQDGKIYTIIRHPDYVSVNPEHSRELVKDISTALTILSGDAIKNLPKQEADSQYLMDNMLDIMNADRLAYDTETSTLDHYSDDAFIIGASFCWAEDKACFVPLEHLDLEISIEEWELRSSLVKQIMESKVPKYAHNGKYDRQMMNSCWGYQPKNEVGDTMLWHHLLNEINGTHSLSKVVGEHLQSIAGYDALMGMLMEEHKKTGGMPAIPLQDIIPYACGDAYAVWKLSYIFEDMLEEQGLKDHALNSVFPANLVYSAMEIRGVKLDPVRANALRREFLIKVTTIEKEIAETQIVKDWYVNKLRENKDKVTGLNVLELEASLKLAIDTGFFVDKKKSTSYRIKCMNNKIATMREEAHYNPGSPPQTKEMYYEFGGLPVQHKYDKGELKVTTGKEARKTLLDLPKSKKRASHAYALELVKTMDNYTKMNKLYTSFLKEFEKYIHDDGLVHTSFNQTGTKTGRLSNSDPNLQQMPHAVHAGDDATDLERWLSKHNVKSMFISKFGEDGVIFNADYSQLELRIMACLSEDNIMRSAYLVGSDLHTQSAKLLFLDFDQVSPEKQKEYRSQGKTWNFASMYAFKKEFLKLYAELGSWVEVQKHFAKTHGYTINPFGRRRRVPGLKSGYGDTQALYRQAINFIIQSAGHDLLIDALVKVHKAIEAANLRSHLVFEVHDSLVVDCHKDEVDIVAEIMFTAMEDTAGIPWVTVPILAEASVGPNWADQKDVENKWSSLDIAA